MLFPLPAGTGSDRTWPLCGATTQRLSVPVPEVRSAPLVVVLPGEHDLEERAVGQAAHRLGQFHHLFEGDVLMLLRGQSLRP